MKYFAFAVVAFSLAITSLMADNPPPSLSPDISVDASSGKLTLENTIDVGLTYAAPEWKHMVRQYRYGEEITMAPDTASGFKFSGKFNVDDGVFDYEQSVVPVDANSVDCHWRIQNASGITAALVYAQFLLPATTYQGTTMEFGADQYKLPPVGNRWSNLKYFKAIDSIVIPNDSKKLIISGTLNGLIVAIPQPSGTPLYELRLTAKPPSGTIVESSLDFRISIK